MTDETPPDRAGPIRVSDPVLRRDLRRIAGFLDSPGDPFFVADLPRPLQSYVTYLWRRGWVDRSPRRKTAVGGDVRLRSAYWLTEGGKTQLDEPPGSGPRAALT